MFIYYKHDVHSHIFLNKFWLGGSGRGDRKLFIEFEFIETSSIRVAF